MKSARVVLPDGRALAYLGHGPTLGTPVLYFHGTPASKHNWYLNHDPGLLEALNLRVFAFDRPGIGDSTFQQGRTLSGCAEDVSGFADVLGLERFALLGYSCGAPFALACALHLGERVLHTTLVSPMADLAHPDLASAPLQPNHSLLRLAATKPWASRSVYGVMKRVAAYLPDMMIRQALSTMPAADQEVILEPEVRRAFLEMLRKTFKQGTRGAQVDSAIVSQPWGLALERFQGKVRVWHGDADLNVPLVMGRHLAGRFSNAELTVIPREGHLSLIHRHIGDILHTTAAAVTGA